MFYRKKSDQYINEGTQFTIDDVTYPSNFLNQSTPEQKLALGLEEVVAENTPYDPRYYWTGEVLDQATLTYTGTAKDLVEVKAQALSEANAMAFSILAPTDYIEWRNGRDPAYKPEWMTWRDSIRAKCAEVKASINQCKTVDAVALAMTGIEWPSDPATATV